jgi:hypothetical protein
MAVLPANEVGRRSILAEHLKNLSVPLRLPLMMSPDYEAITGTRAKRRIVG